MTKLDQAREQVFYAELTAQLSLARQRAAAERERLVRAMGLSGGELDFRLPGALPRLPARPQALPRIEVEALRRRVDLQIARIETEALAKSYGLTNATRFINLLEAERHFRRLRASRAARVSTRAGPASSSRCRSSISARRGCGKPRKLTCRRSTGSPRRR